MLLYARLGWRRIASDYSRSSLPICRHFRPSSSFRGPPLPSLESWVPRRGGGDDRCLPAEPQRFPPRQNSDDIMKEEHDLRPRPTDMDPRVRQVSLRLPRQPASDSILPGNGGLMGVPIHSRASRTPVRRAPSRASYPTLLALQPAVCYVVFVYCVCACVCVCVCAQWLALPARLGRRVERSKPLPTRPWDAATSQLRFPARHPSPSSRHAAALVSPRLVLLYPRYHAGTVSFGDAPSL